MNGEISIEIKQLRFFGYHGLYPEEKKLGGDFEVNLSASFLPGKRIETLQDSFNYELIYKILKSEMKNPRELLETLAMDICQKLHEEFPQMKKAEVEVIKLNPPMAGFNGRIAVRYKKEF